MDAIFEFLAQLVIGLISAVIGFFIGYGVGYGVAAIIDALSQAFARLYRNLVSSAKQVFGYIKEATEYYLALIAQYLDKNWDTIEKQLRNELGYSSDWLIAIFYEAQKTFVQIFHPQKIQGKSMLFSLKVATNQSQLPTKQNPVVNILSLA
ncbi:hypothetical protein PJF56_21310 [Roseofilum sp. BLCC_M91]|uniref:Uncharacterized protein n=1 Tax=Roseofilum halophilum BLCC-M91 TaxID=3022259 RepID=A0ABT7BQC6_9CYAN|nr:hypothetical protein [Roseofilum halophilum]MDJ1181407.1 hypothetical protein [Roseofilum halophilum BLCC-M91]